MKRVLILVLSADVPPYKKMMETAMKTWDSVNLENCETVYYCDKSSKQNTDKIIYLPTNFSLHTMGHKTLSAFEWALQNKAFDYIARVHSSIYVDKKELMKFVEELPESNLFAGATVKRPATFDFLWGGIGMTLSRDVVKKIVENKEKWNHTFMEDESLSLMAAELGISFSDYNRACSIDKNKDEWSCISYCNRSINFTDFSDLKGLGHCSYRVKQDGKREMDGVIMNGLFNALEK